LVEVGVVEGLVHAHEAAFSAMAEVQSQLSRFEPASDVARFNALRANESLTVGEHALAVLAAARLLADQTGDAFDISLGTGPHGWRVEGDRLHKLKDGVTIDLGGIAKGYAVDRAVDALIAADCKAGWVNAGGDLRAFGDIDLPVTLRDEYGGGVRSFARLRDGAIATSRFGSSARSTLASPRAVEAHVSVAAPLCLWADALTKVLSISGDTAHPLLALHHAQGWLH